MKANVLLLALSLVAIASIVTLDIMGVELGDESMTYLKMMADMMAGAGLGASIKGMVDERKLSAAK